jgi:hypothetical protein
LSLIAFSTLYAYHLKHAYLSHYKQGTCLFVTALVN